MGVYMRDISGRLSMRRQGNFKILINHKEF
jgi:hypothetical protein